MERTGHVLIIKFPWFVLSSCIAGTIKIPIEKASITLIVLAELGTGLAASTPVVTEPIVQ